VVFRHSRSEEGADDAVAGECIQADAGTLVQVEPEATRKLVPGPHGVRVLAIGGIPGGSYERPEAFRAEARR
jgi:hypothetical protein